MGSLFSKKKPVVSRVTQQDEAVLQLKTQRDKLKQYQRRIESNMTKEKALAKQLISAGKKDRALCLLKKKKYQETLLDRALKQQQNIETMIHDVEFAQIEMQVLDGLKTGNEALHEIHKAISVEDAERIMDETREAVEYQQEIDSIVSGQLTDTDMDEINAELDQLLESAADSAEDLTEKLPEVPDTELPSPADAEEEKEKRPGAEKFKNPSRQKAERQPVALEA